MFRQLPAALLLCVSALTGQAQAQAPTVIDTTTPPTTLGWHSFGAPDSSTYGEVFSVTAPAAVLNDFALFLINDGTGSLDFKSYIGSWDGTKVSSILYSSPTQTIVGDGSGADLPYAFTPGIALTAGDYVAFLSTSDLGPQPDASFGMPIGLSSGGPGFVFDNNGTNFGALTTTAWDCTDCGTIANVWFKATLTPIPEPASALVFGAGIVGLGLRRRLRGG